MNSHYAKNLSLFIILIALVSFVYLLFNVVLISQKRQTATQEGIYTHCVSQSPWVKEKAMSLVIGCSGEPCKVQKVLDYVSAIPYSVNHFKAHKPQETIMNNYGDCDDKSNLLISLLHALGFEAYFVLVPEHIFVIVALEDSSLLGKKGLWLKGKKYYILESTAKGSKVGFPLQYQLNDISAIIDPFTNQKEDLAHIAYRF